MRTILGFLAMALVACGSSANDSTADVSSTSAMATGDSTAVQSIQANSLVAGMYTVEFNVTLPSGSLPAGNASLAIATVDWTVGGVVTQREVTVGDGVAISGYADAVSVTIQDESSGVMQQSGQAYSVTATLAKGVTPHPTPTLWRGNVDEVRLMPGVSTVLHTPVSAGVDSYEVFITGNAQVLQIDGAGSSVGYNIDASQPPAFVPIAPDTQGVQFTNTSTTDALSVVVFWGVQG